MPAQGADEVSGNSRYDAMSKQTSSERNESAGPADSGPMDRRKWCAARRRISRRPAWRCRYPAALGSSAII